MISFIIIIELMKFFQFNPLLTYTVRFKKITWYPNITVNYTIDQYREKQFVNADVFLNTNEMVDKVSDNYIPYDLGNVGVFKASKVQRVVGLGVLRDWLSCKKYPQNRR